MNPQCLAEAARSDPEQNSHGSVHPSGPCDAPAEIPGFSAEEPLTLETPGVGVMRFPLQKSILAVELCPAETCPATQEEPGTRLGKLEKLEKLEKLSQELPGALEVLELGPEGPCQDQGAARGDPCTSQSGIFMDPCTSQSGISPDPCTSQSQGFGDPSRSQRSPRIPFRLNTCTSSIVERCLSRCQGWFRGKK